jgi:tripartite-type tricarboxylate transporter receptor subunit TctC
VDELMAPARLDRRCLLAAAAGALAWPAASGAQSRFPDHAVRIVVPYGVGIGPDVVARSLGEQLARRWEQPVIIDNKPGASGIIAFSEVRRTPADGHTLFLADTATMVVNPLIHDALPYDPETDLLPLTLLFRTTFAILVGAQSRYQSLAQLLDAARREAASVSYASLGNGHAVHVAIESMARAARLQLLAVPFKDAGALFTAVASGEVDFTAFSLTTVAGLVARGKLRPLAVAAHARLKDHPDLPTLAEAGGPDVEMRPWAGLVALAGTAPARVAQLQADLTAAIALPELRAQFEPLGFELTPSTPQQMRQRVAADLALYEPLVREGRVKKV